MKKTYILKIGLAFTLLYAGIEALLRPFDWVGFVPTWVEKFGLTQLVFLHTHSVVEILLAIFLLAGWLKRPVSILIALDILGIIVVNGFGQSVFPVTFRDVGLLAIAVYLAVEDK